VPAGALHAVRGSPAGNPTGGPSGGEPWGFFLLSNLPFFFQSTKNATRKFGAKGRVFILLFPPKLFLRLFKRFKRFNWKALEKQNSLRATNLLQVHKLPRKKELLLKKKIV